MKISRILFKIATAADAVTSLVLTGITILTIIFDTLVERGTLFSNIQVLGSETFAGYIAPWAPSWTLPLVAAMLFVSAIMMVFMAKRWSSWIISIVANAAILYACLSHQSVILFNPNMGLLVVDDPLPITLSACCLGISLIGLCLKIFRKNDCL